MREYLEELCDGIDAAVFSGDVLYSDEERKELAEYIARWSNAIGEHEAIAAAEQATLCASCARANVDCPVYPQQTASCVEHRPSSKQQAGPVAPPVQWLPYEPRGEVKLGIDMGADTSGISEHPPAVPDGYALVPMALIDSFPELNLSNYGPDDVDALNAWGISLVLAADQKGGA